MNNTNTLTGISTVSKFLLSFLKTNTSPEASVVHGNPTKLEFPDVPNMRMDGFVCVTIRLKLGGSFADGEMYFSSVRPKTNTRSTQTYRVALNFRDKARAETERLMADRNEDLADVVMNIRGDLNWINHQRGPNPIINVDWFRICAGGFPE